jgi:cyanophycinase-like exopeptidase
MRFAWLGAGEFEDWHDGVDRWLLDGSTGRVLILPTASAREGNEVYEGWGSKGLTHYGRSGIDAEVVRLKTREDAFRDDLVGTLDEASVVFFSGGESGVSRRGP